MTNILHLSIALLLILSLSAPANAQISKAIEIDTITGGTKEAVTADKETLFILPVANNTKVQNINYYRVDKNGCKIKMPRRDYRNLYIKEIYLTKTKKCNLSLKERFDLIMPAGKSTPIGILKKENKYSNFDVLKAKSQSVVKLEKTTNLYITTHPFDPSSNYQFEIYQDKNEIEVSKAFEIIHYIRNAEITEAEELFEKVYPRNPKAFYNQPFDGLFENLGDASESADPILISGYNKLIKDKGAIAIFIEKFNNCYDTTSYSSLFEAALSCSKCKEDAVHSDIFKSRDQFINDYYNSITRIEDINSFEKTSDIKNIKKLYTLIKDSTGDRYTYRRYIAMITILDWRKAALQRLLEGVSKLENRPLSDDLSAKIKTNIQCIDGIKTQSDIAEFIKDCEYIKKGINSNAQIRKSQRLGNNGEILSINTNIFNFKTRGESIINPCFGFVAVGSLKSNQTEFWDVPTYAGFHINLRPIDKNTPFRLMPNRNYRHYLSLFVGLTLTSISEEGKREDLFGKKSLLTGVGFRINNAIRLTSGALWFKELNTNPIKTDKSAAILPFAGLSIDLDLKSLFGGISGLFN
jgi:hypothetical protein